MKLNKTTLFIIILVFGVGGIGLSMALNAWDAQPGTGLTGANANSNQQGYMPTDNTTPMVPVQSPYNPAEIKGTNTFAEISQMFYIPINELGEAFGLTAIQNYSRLTARELKAIYTNLPQDVKLETESVRAFVAMYVNKPYDYSSTTYLPVPAVTILRQKAKLSQEQLVFLEKHTIDISRWQSGSIASPTTTNKRTVTGETSFQTIIAWGVPIGEIEKVIGEKLTVTNVLIRDYAAQRGKDFLTIVGSLQQLVNNYN